MPPRPRQTHARSVRPSCGSIRAFEGRCQDVAKIVLQQRRDGIDEHRGVRKCFRRAPTFSDESSYALRNLKLTEQRIHSNALQLTRRSRVPTSDDRKNAVADGRSSPLQPPASMTVTTSGSSTAKLAMEATLTPRAVQATSRGRAEVLTRDARQHRGGTPERAIAY